MRVAALYDRTKWVGRGLWTLSGLLYIISIVIIASSVKAVFGEGILAGIGKMFPLTNPQIDLCMSRYLGCAYRSMSPTQALHPIFHR